MERLVIPADMIDVVRDVGHDVRHGRFGEGGRAGFAVEDALLLAADFRVEPVIEGHDTLGVVGDTQEHGRDTADVPAQVVVQHPLAVGAPVPVDQGCAAAVEAQHAALHQLHAGHVFPGIPGDHVHRLLDAVQIGVDGLGVIGAQHLHLHGGVHVIFSFQRVYARAAGQQHAHDDGGHDQRSDFGLNGFQ